MKLYAIVEKWFLVSVHSEDTYNDLLISNYYQTRFEKNALMIYIIHPFIFPDEVPQHTNQAEARAMANVLGSKGYNADIINTAYTGTLKYEKYDLILGFGPKFDDACSKRGNSTLSVCYLTESSPYFSNIAELKRLRYSQKRNGYLPGMERQSARLLDLSALIKADAAICLGNHQTLSTYEGMFDKIYPLNVSGFSDCPLPSLQKDILESRKNFLWYGGAGPIPLCQHLPRNTGLPAMPINCPAASNGAVMLHKLYKLFCVNITLPSGNMLSARIDACLY